MELKSFSHGWIEYENDNIASLSIQDPPVSELFEVSFMRKLRDAAQTLEPTGSPSTACVQDGWTVARGIAFPEPTLVVSRLIWESQFESFRFNEFQEIRALTSNSR